MDPNLMATSDHEMIATTFLNKAGKQVLRKINPAELLAENSLKVPYSERKKLSCWHLKNSGLG